MKEGWITVHRKILESFVWDDKPFSRGQAWIDMLLTANYEDRKMFRGNRIVTIERGSFSTTVRGLAERWGWGKAKVTSFLDVLEKEKMITKLQDKNGTVITIENYKVYQTSKDTRRDTQGTLAGHLQDTCRTSSYLYNKETSKQRNKNKGKSASDQVQTVAVKDKFGEYENVLLTQEEFDKLVEKYGVEGRKAIDFLSAYIEEKGYRSKSHYLAIQRWVLDAVKEQERKRGKESSEKKDRLSVIDDWGV